MEDSIKLDEKKTNAMNHGITAKSEDIEKEIKNSPLEDLLNVKDLSVYLKVHPSWVYMRVRKRTIPHLKVGKYLRFRKEEVDTWLYGVK